MGVVKTAVKWRSLWVNAYITPFLDNNGNVFEYQSVPELNPQEQIYRNGGLYQQINQENYHGACVLPTRLIFR